MNDRLTIKELATILSKSSGKDFDTVEKFLREFISIVRENVFADRLVQIKGIGTFKIIQVEKRESVDVNTKERIVIPEHYKLSFTPEKELRDIVNKPFSFFESIEINEDENFAPEESADEGKDKEEESEILETEIVETIPVEENVPEVESKSASENKEDIEEEQKEEENVVEPVETSIPPVVGIEEKIEEKTDAIIEDTAVNVEVKDDVSSTDDEVMIENKDSYIPEEKESVMEEQLPPINEIVIDKEITEDNEPEPAIIKEEIVSETITYTATETEEEKGNDKVETIYEKLYLSSTVVEEKNETIITGVNEQAENMKETPTSNMHLTNQKNENEMTDYNEERKSRRDDRYEPEERRSNNTVVALLSGLVIILAIALVSVLFMNKDAIFGSDTKPTTVAQTENAHNQFSLPPDDSDDDLEDEWGIEDDFDDTAITGEEETSSTSSATTGSGDILATVRTKRGDRLNLIALEYYGNKLFWVYIYEHNKSKITNPNSIPVGLDLVVPAKSVYQIDANDPASVRKASVLQTQILSKYQQYNDPYMQYQYSPGNDPYGNQYQNQYQQQQQPSNYYY